MVGTLRSFAGVIGGLGIALIGAGSLSAQRATQTIAFRVEAVAEVAVSGSPSLTISTATAGQAPTSVTSTEATWAVTTNLTGAKVTVSLAAAMPDGVTLSANLGAPVGATSAGLTPLSTTPIDLVTNITTLSARGLPVTYRLDAVPKAGVVTQGTRVVIFTIAGGV